ncbi:hypothetical protein GE061_015253 [Apolygus lucorum]|uniref:MD-2-related lipid-recognition domain-containing protein n=1 Tax=Apolygus lucorum TaxID=248454 RepID=A0A8S9XN91_APOLU|nr:hypothetical protein GE061_015253 [Apolygus lucorum]
MIVLRLLLLSTLLFNGANSSGNTGSYSLSITSVGDCQAELEEEELIKFEVRSKKLSRAKLMLRINASLHIPMDDRLDIKVNVAKQTNQGWKNNFFIIELKKACSALKFYLPSVEQDISRQLNIKSCPIPILRSARGEPMKNSTSGPFDVVVSMVDHCPKGMNGENLFLYEIKLKRQSRKKLILNANATFLIPIDDNLDIQANLAKQTNQGWKDNFFILDIPRACSAFSIYVPALEKEVARQTNLQSGKCPVPAGNYSIALPLILDLKLFPIFTYGKYRARFFLLRNHTKTVCLESIVNGPFNVIVSTVDHCPDALVPENQFNYTIKLKRESRKRVVAHINSTLYSSISDMYDMTANFAKQTSQGWKDNFFLLDFPKACSCIKKYLPKIGQEIARQANLKGELCPIPVGNYSFVWPVGVDVNYFPAFTYGKYRVRCFLVQGRKRHFCIEAIINVVPKKAVRGR